MKCLEKDMFSPLNICRTLSLNHNFISLIEDGTFNGLGMLFTLHLQDNLITELNPTIFFGLISLRKLFLHKNQITTLERDLLKDVPMYLSMSISSYKQDAKEYLVCDPNLCWLKNDEKTRKVM